MTDRRGFLAASGAALCGLAHPGLAPGVSEPRIPGVAGVTGPGRKPGVPGVPGRLKQSACRWPYRHIPLPDFCRAAAAMGLAAIDLLGSDEWGVVREHGLVCSMGYPAIRGDFIASGVADRANHRRICGERDPVRPE